MRALRVALATILRNRVRAALTVLGILIGVAALIAVTTLATGVSAKVTGSLDEFASNGLTVVPQSPLSGNRQVTRKLTESDARALAKEAGSVANVAPYLSNQIQVVVGDRNEATTAVGTSSSYFQMRRFTLAHGVMWTESEELHKTRVCVLGSSLATHLFAGGDPIGQTVRVGRSPFRVIGVLTSRGASALGDDQDNVLLMPIGSYRGRVRRTQPGRVDQIHVAARSKASVDRADKEITAILRQRHHLRPSATADFAVNTQSELLRLEEAIVSALSTLLFCVAGVSLLVGGIGVMNIMLVSVTERTREIGIRLSIGARSRDILAQFLVEATALSVVGGLLGLAIGAGLTWGLGRALGVPLVPSATSVAVAVLTSAAIGIFFGFLPARKAAALDPIEALRTD